MANWYYHNKNGEKVGPISVAALRALVQRGLVTRETVIQNHTGRTHFAGEVNGLTFPELSTVTKNEVLSLICSQIITLTDRKADERISSRSSEKVELPQQADVVEPRTTIKLSCPSCNRSLKAESKHAGRTLKCPACQSAVSIPVLAVVPPPIPSSVKNTPKTIVAAAVPATQPSQEQKTEDHRSEFQPLDEYANVYKQRHAENVSNFFEELFVQSGVNQEENRVVVKKVNKLQAALDVENKSLRRAKFLRGWLIFAIVLSVLAGSIAVSVLVEPRIMEELGYPRQRAVTISELTIVFGVLVTAASFWAIFAKINPRIKGLKSAITNLEGQRDSQIAVARKQMQPLNDLFRRYMSSRLMEKTYPLIKLDDYFDIKRYDCLSRKYGLWDNRNVDSSAIFLQSGEINGNPFCFFTNLRHYLGTETYSGSRKVTWTEIEEYTDSEGKKKTRTVEKSETLYAYVTKPCPRYHTDSTLVYGNEAAPNLSFTREDTDAEYWNEKKTQREVNKRIKQVNAKMRKAVKEGKTFTSMGNEFEALFGATDRDNEVEFRVLFTPIAQREILKLIKDKTLSWGDDFNFSKRKMLNLIGSDHLTDYDMSGSTINYQHYNIDTIRKKFNDYNNEYFRALYFAFAPLLAIPLYQQHKPHEFIYRDVYQERFACHAHEYAVNKKYSGDFAHPESRTKNILKTAFVSGDQHTDTVTVTAYGYRTEDRTDHVDVRCSGNGQTYSVSVNWVEYLPVQRTTNATIDEWDV